MPKPPDVRVRLSAEGVDEVVKAFDKITKEAGKTAHGVGVLNAAGRELGSIIPTLGLAAAVGGLIGLTKHALENADAQGKLAQKTGASVEVLSVLSLAATTANVEQQALGESLQHLVRSMGEASAGASKQGNAFRTLGISMKEVRSTDPGEMFVKLADRLSKVDSETRRAQLAQQLFGRSGAELLPLLNDLADGGFDKVRQKAERMGLVFDSQLTKAAERANDALTDLGNIARGVATQFVVGAAPKMADALERFGNDLADGKKNGFQRLGEWAGNTAKFIVATFEVAASTVAYLWEDVPSRISRAWEGFKRGSAGAATGIAGFVAGIKGARDANANDPANAGRLAEYRRQLAQTINGFRDTTEPTKHKGGGTGGVGDTADRTALANATIAFLKAQADNELAIQRARNKISEDENKRSFEDGLESLQKYFDRRKELITTEAEDELANLKEKLRLTESEQTNSREAEIKQQEQIAQLRTQIYLRERQEQADLKALEFERANAEIQHNVELLSIEERLAAAEGNRFKAAQLALDTEIAKTDELLRKQGVGDVAREAALKKIRNQGESRIQYQYSSQDANLALADLDLSKRAIQRQADSGQISQIAAQGQIIQLEQQRLAGLREIGAAMLANAQAANDPQLILSAEEYNAKLDDIEASLHRTTSAAVEFTNQFATVGRNALVGAFTDIITGAKSFGDAWAEIGKAFEGIIAEMIAKILVFYTILVPLSFLFPGLTEIIAAGPFGFAEGGFTGNQPKDKPAGVVHGREYVLSAAATARWGVPLLDMMNKGTFPGWTAMATGGYASGGYVEPSASTGAGAGGVEVNVINGSGQPAQTSQRTGADGKQIIDIIIGTVAQDIATGGRVAQTIQRTYSVGRSGVKIG